MGRMYIEGDSARLVRRNFTTVDMTLRNGTTLQNLEPRRLFPVSEERRYIALLDENGVEQAVIRDVSALPEEQQKVIEDCLAEYYLVPKIQKILRVEERFDGLTLHTVTDKGPVDIEIRVLLSGFKMVQGCRALLRDINDNRYEVPDVTKLDKHSRQILARYL